MKLKAEFNHHIPYVASKFGNLPFDKKTGDMFIWTAWVGFDTEERTM
jgi:hypothetical protein